MSTTVLTPRLSEVARHLVIPEGITTSLFPRIERRLASAGVSFDLWQRGVGQLALGCRADGKLAATVGGVVLSWPRQVGKTYTVGGLQVGDCLEFPGTRVAWTSHHNRTTTNTFRALQGLVRRKNIWPHIKDIRTANGEQEITFINGSLIMFGAREQGFGRGLDEIDRLIFDEAQILGLKALEDMVPAANQAKHPHGGLVYYMGTPPRPSDDGEAFTAKRQRAIDGKTVDQVYIELSAADDADPFDASTYAFFNPSFPHRTPLEAMQRMLDNLPDEESVRREMQGIWPIAGSALISEAMWNALSDSASEPVDPVSFGVYLNRDQTHAAIGVAGYRGDGKIHVGVVPAASGQGVTTLPGTGWIAPRVQELAAKWKPCSVVIDARSEAGALIEDIQALGVDVETTNSVQMSNACGRFLAAVKEDELRHNGSSALRASVCSGKKRALADAWAWDRKDTSSDITQLVAVTLALNGLLMHGRAPTVEVWEPLWT